MANNTLPTPETLRELLAYDPETGALTWLARPDGRQEWNTRFADKPAFTAMNNGYRIGRIFDRGYLAHRVIWAIVYGVWPSADIDHISGVRSDNRVINLRSVTRKENTQNAATYKNNTSGTVGVSWRKSNQKWHARIAVDGWDVHIGYFTTFEEAAAARLAASVQHGFHENHGRAA